MNALADYATLPSPLTSVERQELSDYEATIERGLNTFYEVGNAFVGIKQRKLYRAEYRTFEEYCREKWGISKQHAGRMIDAAEVVDNLKKEPIGYFLPDTESQARELKGLEPDQQRQVWQKAVDTAPNGKVTAQHIKDVRQVEIPMQAPKDEPKMMITTNHPISVFVPQEQPLPKYGPCARCGKQLTGPGHFKPEGAICDACDRLEWEQQRQQDDEPDEQEPEPIEVEPETKMCLFCGERYAPDQVYTPIDNQFVVICPACTQNAARNLGIEKAFQFMHQDRARMCAAGLFVLRVDLYKRQILSYDDNNGGSWKPRLKCKNDDDLEGTITRISEEPNTIFENRI